MLYPQELGNPHGIVACSPDARRWVTDAGVRRIEVNEADFTALQGVLEVTPVVPDITVLRSPDESGLKAPDRPQGYVDYSDPMRIGLLARRFDRWREGGAIIAELPVDLMAWRADIEGHLAVQAVAWTLWWLKTAELVRSKRSMRGAIFRALGVRSIRPPPAEIMVTAKEAKRAQVASHSGLRPYRVLR